jgi:hypothetical protein
MLHPFVWCSVVAERAIPAPFDGTSCFFTVRGHVAEDKLARFHYRESMPSILVDKPGRNSPAI